MIKLGGHLKNILFASAAFSNNYFAGTKIWADKNLRPAKIKGHL